ncbi:MAG: tetratricopeptide repeat protein, partial [Sedimentisphaerales bacterium]|nr:tetratricopeptide repeat protein [Sedimentisphaerales bacterium]
MSLRNFVKFFTARSLLEQVAAGLIVAIILGIWGLWWYFKIPKSVVIKTGPNSVSQTAVGDNVYQDLKIDDSRRQSGGIHIERVESGATVNINVIDYQDGVSQSAKSEVRALFQKARTHYANRELQEAIEDFARCLDLEKDSKKRGAINVQIGNCFYEQQMYLKSAEFYAAGLRESRKAKDLQGEASNLVGIANTYMDRPASSGEARGDNIRKAVEHYTDALKVFNKDEYPVDYATTQNNLGNAYMNLPSATPEEHAKNVRSAIDCYHRALEIYKKDEYPVQYATTQNNLGNTYTNLPSVTAEERAKNVRAAIDCYRAALEIRKKDEYPVEYAMTQNNLGNAYRALPSATPEERAKNVRSAIDCYQRALEIRKK